MAYTTASITFLGMLTERFFMGKKQKEHKTDTAISLLNICCLLVVDVSLVPTGKWPLMALICLIMLVEVGVMGYRIARDRENDRRDDDE